MAKKKLSNIRNDKALQTQDDAVKSHQETPSPMESDKFESLKSLNQRLLKDEVERRQQVEALLQTKYSLEMELSQSNSERGVLESELARMVERAAVLDVERRVFVDFVAVQVVVKGEEFDLKIKGLEMEIRESKRESEEKESEIVRLKGSLGEIESAVRDEREVSRRVSVERDDFEEKLVRQIKEDEELRENLTDLNGKMKDIQREIEELRTSYNAALREKEDKEMRIKVVMEEIDSSKRGLMESNKLLEKMEEEIIGIVREKESVEKEKNEETVRRRDLENTVIGLNQMVANLQEEEVKLHRVVAELEKKCTECEEKLKGMEMDTTRLFDEMYSSEKRIQELVEANSTKEKHLEEVVNKLAEQKRETEGLANEKIVMLEAKAGVDGEVGELRKHVDELKVAVTKFEELNQADIEKIRRLESEVVDYKFRVEKVSTEREGLEIYLDEEKQKALKFKEMIEELEKSVEESHKAAGEVKAENAAILTEKVELERHCEMQKKEIDSLQNTVVEARSEFDSLRSKVELADANSEQVLKMLKDISEFCSKDGEQCENNMIVDGDENLKWHAMEMQSITSAFARRAAKVEEMKRQLESLQISVVDAEKKKSFWTVFSSATTVVAAVSLAYVARGR